MTIYLQEEPSYSLCLLLSLQTINSDQDGNEQKSREQHNKMKLLFFLALVLDYCARHVLRGYSREQ